MKRKTIVTICAFLLAILALTATVLASCTPPADIPPANETVPPTDAPSTSDTDRPKDELSKTRPMVHNAPVYHIMDISVPPQRFEGFTYVFEMPSEWKGANDYESNGTYVIWNNETQRSESVLFFRNFYKVEKDFVLDETIQEKASAWYMLNLTEDKYPKGEKKVTLKGYEYVIYPTAENVYIRLSDEYILQFYYSSTLVSEEIIYQVINSFEALGAYKTKSFTFTVNTAILNNNGETSKISEQRISLNAPEEYSPNDNFVFGQEPFSFDVVPVLINADNSDFFPKNCEQRNVPTPNGYKYDRYTTENGNKCYNFYLTDDLALNIQFHQVPDGVQKAILHSLGVVN